MLSAIALLILLTHHGAWRDQTQLAWVGIQATDDQPLIIGGDINHPASGWPRNAFAPRVEFHWAHSSGSDGRLEMLSSCGSGFLLDGNDNVLYGKALKGPTRLENLDAFELLVERQSAKLWKVNVRETGRTWLVSEKEEAIHVPQSSDYVVSLSGLLNRTLRRMRSSWNDSQSGPLSNWADHVTLLFTSGGRAYYVSDRDNPQSAVLAVSASTRIVLRWPRVKLEVKPTDSHGDLRLLFQPPFRHSGPLPPEDAPFESALRIESTPAPGDKAFLLPISLLQADSVEVGITKSGLFEAGPTTPQLAIPVPPQFHEDYEDFPGVTSSKDLIIGRYHFFLDTIRSIPSSFARPDFVNGLPLWVPLLPAWFVYTLCLFPLCWSSRDDLDYPSLGALLGISLAAWTVLCIRVALAFRFAANPSTLDDLGIHGLTMAIETMAFLPGFLLAVGYHFSTDSWDPLRKRGTLLILTALVPLTLVPMFMAGIWPLLNITPIEALSNDKFLWRLDFLWLLLGITIWLGNSANRGAKERLASLHGLQRISGWRSWLVAAALRFVIVSKSASNPKLGQGLIRFESWINRLWRKRWPQNGRPLIVVTLFAIAATVCAFFTRDTWLNGFAKEVFAPLLQLAAIVAFLTLYDNTLEPRRGGRWRSARAAAWTIFYTAWITTLLFVFPFLVLPIAFGDTGGIYGGLAFLVPSFLVLLFMREHRLVALWPLCASIGLLVVLALVFPTIAGTRGHARLESWVHPSKWVQSNLLYEQANSAKGDSIAQQLDNADSNLWANRRMAQIGGIVGKGFLNTRPQKAGIPLQTLQADSTYSFYVASEHGSLGGISILLLTALPLAFVAWRRGQELGWRSHLLLIVSAAFLLETMFHIIMNALGWLPVTGRSMPLLSVQSPSDIARWALLLSVITIMVVCDQSASVTDHMPIRWPTKAFTAFIAAALLLIPFAPLLGKVPETYSREDAVSRQIDILIGNDYLKLDENSGRIQPSEALESRLNDTQLQQEIERFNGLPIDERLARPDDFHNVSNISQYMDFMKKWASAPKAPRRVLFRVIRHSRDGEDLDPAQGEQQDKIAFNPGIEPSTNLDTILDPTGLRTLSWRDGESDGLLLEGYGVHLKVNYNQDAKQIPVEFKITGDSMIATRSTVSSSPLVYLDCARQESTGHNVRGSTKAAVRLPLLKINATPAGSTIAPVAHGLKIVYRRSNDSEYKSLIGPVAIDQSVTVQTAERFCRFHEKPIFRISPSKAGSLVGFAWVDGEWIVSSDRTANLPILEQLSEAFRLKQSSSVELNQLTLDRALQAKAEDFVESHGRELQNQLLENYGACSEHENSVVLPPRIALSIMTAPKGEMVALGGWPRSSSTEQWEPVKDDDGNWIDVRPPAHWLLTDAPRSIRDLYLGDRNFDLEIVGSSSKPLWAGASLEVNMGLSKLEVQGRPFEDDLFGLRIPGGPWSGSELRGYQGFDSFLAESINSYQIDLNFLSLAPKGAGDEIVRPERDRNGRVLATKSDSVRFARPWRMIPDLSQYGFTESHPGTLKDLNQSQLAHRMSAHFPLETTSGSSTLPVYNVSFWTGDERDNHFIAIDDPLARFALMSPARTNLELDQISTPRQYISVLLGGETNRWSNIDLSSSVYTASFGEPLVPHIVMNAVQPSVREPLRRPAAEAVRNGLREMVVRGTGEDYLTKGDNPLSVSFPLSQYEFYAKTGTLGQGSEASSKNGVCREPDMARIVLIILRRHSNKGLILSLMVEHGGKARPHSRSNVAVKWISEFIAANKEPLQNLVR